VTKTRPLELNEQLLRDRYYYDSESPSGLRMRIRTGAHNPKVVRNPGDVAGFKNMYGYWEVGITAIYLKVHRIIWIIEKGQIPDGLEVDHKDGNHSNNRLDNLQLLTGGANSRARNRLYANNKTGYVGVYPTRYNGWVAIIRRENKNRQIGTFSNPISAAKAYNAAAIEWAQAHGETPRYLNPI
jgi:hypothetical protein